MTLSGHFIPSSKGRIFVSQFGELNGDTAVMCLPSIVEELNLSRAVLAKQCQIYAERGIDSFIMDYFGTGDSEGEFEQATLQGWFEDIINVGQWLVARGYKKLILLGVRVGALLAATLQEKLHKQLPIVAQILWKPVTSGKIFVSQLIRIKTANQMMNNRAGNVNWRKEILAGNDTEVAGYKLTSEFIRGIEALAIATDTDWQSSVDWVELATESLTPATKRLTQDNKIISTHILNVPPFWQVPEIFDLPELHTLGERVLTSRLEA